MSANNKIAWLESQYLYPHHFQQQERYIEYTIEQRCNAIKPFVYGFINLEINYAQLDEGKFSLLNVKGIMPDGCTFDNLVNAAQAIPLEVPNTVKNQLIYLALPTYQPGRQLLSTDEQSQRMGRYKLEEIDAYDYSSTTINTERIEVARLQPRFLLESEELGGFTCLPIARITEVTPENAIILDKNFIPPTINIKASSTLSYHLDNVNGLLEQRGNALSARFQASSSTGGSSAIADFMLLQLINRCEPRLKHLQHTANKVHPESLYLELLGLMGELSTFTTNEKRPLSIPKYNHDDLYQCFQPLMQNINMHLSAVLEQTAITLPVEKRQYGIYVSPIADRSLLDNTRLILDIKAQMPTSELKAHLPDHLKIGSVETIRDLVNNQLTGITVIALPVAPREITYHAGFVYFELDNTSEHWKSVTRSAGFAFNIAGELCDIDVEFWAIRSS